MLKKTAYALAAFNRFLCYGSAFLTLFLMVLIPADIFGRFFLHKSIVGTPAFARNALVGITFLALPWLTWEQKHLRSELMIDRSKGAFKKILELSSGLIGVVIFVLYSIALYKPTMHSIEINEMDVEGMTFIPISPFYIVCWLACILAAASALKCLWTMITKKDSDDSPKAELTGFEV
jgi:TRAP-type C4-dicarboxylate transport system permease small subunit